MTRKEWEASDNYQDYIQWCSENMYLDDDMPDAEEDWLEMNEIELED